MKLRDQPTKQGSRTYRILIEADERTGTNEPAYTAYIPTLGIATDGDTLEETLENAREAIDVYVASLEADQLDISEDRNGQYLVATTTITR